MKEIILKLHAEGKSYNEICKIVGCSKGSVSYHCNPQVKRNFFDYQNERRKQAKINLKIKFGGKCNRCGYSKCLAALQFHHTDPTQKDGMVSRIMKTNGAAAAKIEAQKCELICANCHAEEHSSQIVSA